MKTLWQELSSSKGSDKETGAIPKFESLIGEVNTDVLVIGGGLAGLLTAFLLKEKGVDCILAESNRLCSGASGKTTAKITAQHGFIYSKILKLYGRETARMYYEVNSNGVDRLKSLCKTARCTLEEKDNYVYSRNKQRLEEELEALEKIKASVKYRERLPLPLPLAGGLGFEKQGQFNPVELCAFLSKGLRIFENTRVEKLSGTTAYTRYGKIKAKKVVVTTHFPFVNSHGSYFLKLYQYRSYILALENATPLEEMYVDESSKGLSFSSFNGYLLLGGGGHRTGKRGEGYNRLRSFAKEHYKEARKAFAWANQDTVSLDGMPYIGNYSGNTPDVYVAAGFNKWGMTGSMISADILVSLLTKGASPYDKLFSPSRSILRPQLAVNSLEATKNLLIPLPKRCPHLGCALRYNKQEHSWDCACHGSRFSSTGRVLDGPANGNLKMN